MTDLQHLVDDAGRDGIQKLVVGEHESYRWITPDELPGSGLTGETAQVVYDWAATRR
ncbi:hypothetical protein ACIBCT_05530 [Streptosporangium sp. NPDC050855]|uniref:hypothetical protein n=1 Tax=Streptosporangium sp. NPDC050855 TaxID=3366194 RepID=UPI003799BAAF